MSLWGTQAWGYTAFLFAELRPRVMPAGLQLKRNGKPMTMWNRDCTDYPDLNLYGSHPFLLEVRPGAQSVCLLQSILKSALLVAATAKPSQCYTASLVELAWFCQLSRRL